MRMAGQPRRPCPPRLDGAYSCVLLIAVAMRTEFCEILPGGAAAGDMTNIKKSKATQGNAQTAPPTRGRTSLLLHPGAETL